MSASQTDIPLKQKAWLVVKKGLPNKAVVLKEDADVPKLDKGEVLIKVQAAAMNPVGYKVMKLAPSFLFKRPHVAEHDFTGIVVDANGTDGDLQGRATSPQTQGGALAQYIRCPAEFVLLRPGELKPTEAAGMALVGITAYGALFSMAKLEPGQSVFINGGSTGVGIVAIQVAKALGCKVTATGSTRREELLKSLGVDRFIDYTAEAVYKQLERDPPSPKFHVMLEAVGNTDVPLYTHSEAYLAPDGLFISVGPYPRGFSGLREIFHLLFKLGRPKFLGGVKRKWVPISKLPLDEMNKFGEFVSDGRVKMVVDSVYSFDEVQQAYERIMSQRAAGKVVVKVDPDVE